MITIGLPAGSRAPCVQYARNWSRVTACHPATFSPCICAANSAGVTYRPGNGAPLGGGAITWYMSTGTVAVPGVPVAGPSAAAVDPPWLRWTGALLRGRAFPPA